MTTRQQWTTKTQQRPKKDMATTQQNHTMTSRKQWKKSTTTTKKGTTYNVQLWWGAITTRDGPDDATGIIWALGMFFFSMITFLLLTKCSITVLLTRCMIYDKKWQQQHMMYDNDEVQSWVHQPWQRQGAMSPPPLRHYVMTTYMAQ